MARKGITHARALEIQEDIAAWMVTENATEFFFADFAHAYQTQTGFDPLDNRELVLLSSEASRIAELEAMRKSVPVYCTTDFALMTLTMSATAPADSITMSDLPAPAGILIFEEPFDLARDGGRPVPEIRALSWHLREAEGKDTILNVRFWSGQATISPRFRVMSRDRLYAGGANSSAIDDSRDRHADYRLVRLLRSAFTLMRSPLTGDEKVPRNPKTNPRTKRSLSTDSVRRVYLHRPEYARYEADEAAAEREGRAPMRAHWVRGHWRNQPYPKLGDRKWIWIDGFIKGSPEHGTVTGKKILIARVNAPEEFAEPAAR